MEHIKQHKLYNDTDPIDKQVYNLMIAYFMEDYEYIQGHLIDLIRQLDYAENKEFYYLITINIFIINQFINHLMSKSTW